MGGGGLRRREETDGLPDAQLPDLLRQAVDAERSIKVAHDFGQDSRLRSAGLRIERDHLAADIWLGDAHLDRIALVAEASTRPTHCCSG